MAKTQPIFRDLSLSFAPNPFTGDASVVSNEAAISQSIKNILLTDWYEVPFQPRFGGNIRALLFELSSPLVVAELKSRIRLAIENFEPRVEILDLDVKDDSDNNRYAIQIVYTAVTSDQATSASFFLERVL